MCEHFGEADPRASHLLIVVLEILFYLLHMLMVQASLVEQSSLTALLYHQLGNTFIILQHDLSNQKLASLFLVVRVYPH